MPKQTSRQSGSKRSKSAHSKSARSKRTATPVSKSSGPKASRPKASGGAALPRGQKAIDGADRLTGGQLAWAYGMSAMAISKWRQGECPRNADGTHDLRAVIRWREEKVRAEAAEAAPGGSNSPAMERLREENARIKRLMRLELEGELVRKDAMTDALGSLAHLLRGAAERVQKAFGGDARQMIDEALDDFEREVDRRFGDGSELTDED